MVRLTNPGAGSSLVREPASPRDLTSEHRMIRASRRVSCLSLSMVQDSVKEDTDYRNTRIYWRHRLMTSAEKEDPIVFGGGSEDWEQNCVGMSFIDRHWWHVREVVSIALSESKA